MSCLSVNTCTSTITAANVNTVNMDNYTSVGIYAALQGPPSPTTSCNIVDRAALAPLHKRTPSPERRAVRKSVKFSANVDVKYTHTPEDYDRTAAPMAKLNFRDFAELMQVRAMVRRQAEEIIREAAMGRVAKGNLPALRARGVVQF
jgi:hypothetical protein